MNMMEMLQALKDGKSLSRECWKMEDGYVVLMRGMKHAWKILPYPNPNAGNHIFSIEELCAEDWCEYNEAKFEEKPEAA